MPEASEKSTDDEASDKDHIVTDSFEDAKEDSTENGQAREQNADGLTIAQPEAISDSQDTTISSTSKTEDETEIKKDTQDLPRQDDGELMPATKTDSLLRSEHTKEQTKQISNTDANTLKDLEIGQGAALERTVSPGAELENTNSLSPTRHSAKASFTSLASLSWTSSSATTKATNDTKPSQAPSGGAGARRFGTGLSSWLSRKSSHNAEVPTRSSTDGLDRRNTVTSISSLHSNSDLLLSRLDPTQHAGSDAEQRSQQESLKNRFNVLRQREEGISRTSDVQGQRSRATSSVADATSFDRKRKSTSSSLANVDQDSAMTANETALGDADSCDAASIPAVKTSPDPSLAPGTAVGMSSGLSAIADPANPVDWDLWQAVVFEGPSVVISSSAEQLGQAIMKGIPHAIRGVVWQVLAESKNHDLEIMYRQLVARGTDDEIDHNNMSRSRPGSQTSLQDMSKDRELARSSAVSAQSKQSAALPQANAAEGSEAKVQASGADSDALNSLHAERQRKAKEDRVAVQKLEKIIRRDLGARTSYSKYAASAGLQQGLFGVCKAYALFDEGVGYAQGMNFLVMPLLFNMPEEEAFCLLVRLMNHYGLREMFIRDMPGLHLHLYQFERLLEDVEPALYCHLRRKHVMPELYATQWFLTLFAYRFPLQLVLRVYDLILSEGLEGAILKIGIVLMQKNAEALLMLNDMTSLTTFLKERLFDIYIDSTPSSHSLLESGFFGSSGAVMDKEVYRADILVQDACAVKLNADMLKEYAQEWEEKLSTDRERETELESLKTSNTTLTSRVRTLEERIETSDKEHVQMASDLVRTKVDNETLHDEIESLRGQTAEYRALVDTQTQQVEARLQAEMDRIMERNAHVQNENRALEEQMAEMEKVLVETKMHLAEINGEHETLKQKWADLRKAIA